MHRSDLVGWLLPGSNINVANVGSEPIAHLNDR
jgi:hypothetical protein